MEFKIRNMLISIVSSIVMLSVSVSVYAEENIEERSTVVEEYSSEYGVVEEKSDNSNEQTIQTFYPKETRVEHKETENAVNNELEEVSNNENDTSTKLQETLVEPEKSADDPVGNYIDYLDSYNGEYDEFKNELITLSKSEQAEVIDTLVNGGKLDVEIIPDNSTYQTRAVSRNRSVGFNARFGLYGITFVEIRVEGRFTHNGSRPIKVEYKNAYISKRLLPFTGFSRSSLDAYISGKRFYVKSAFTAYVGAKIGKQTIGVKPRTFYANFNAGVSGSLKTQAW